MKNRLKTHLLAFTASAVVFAASANAATIIYTNSGAGTDMGDAEGWGSSDHTTSAAILEVNFDYTQAAIDALALANTDALVSCNM